jgi:hypothetical protein
MQRQSASSTWLGWSVTEICLGWRSEAVSAETKVFVSVVYCARDARAAAVHVDFLTDD